MDTDSRRVEAVVRTDAAWLRFARPARIVQGSDAASVGYTIATVEQMARARSAWAVGFVSYEAGAAYGLRVHVPSDLPLAWFAIFDRPPARFDDLDEWCPERGASSILGRMRPTVTFGGFEQAFNRIKAHIAAGDSYQANYTFRLEGRISGESRELFASLVRSQPGPYSAFIRTGDLVVCSASPELFFRRVGRRLIARPMKGPRAPRPHARGGLFAAGPPSSIDKRTRRERDDRRHEAERHRPCCHRRNGVCSRAVRSRAIPNSVADDVGRGGRDRRDARPDLRGATPFGVRDRSRVSFGVGSGIVWDSSAEAEYEECLLKAAVLGASIPTFELLETLRWSREDGFYLLERHLRWMRDSAEYFEFEYDERKIRAELAGAVAGATDPSTALGAGSLRVRLRLSSSGVANVECTSLQVSARPLRLRFSAEPVSRDNVFLYHKTTNRVVYDRARRDDADDVCLWNDGGEVTESTIANIVVELSGGLRVTPPLACGLLAGTFRAELLERGEIAEGIVRVEELSSASRVWLINSVQGWRPATLVG